MMLNNEEVIKQMQSMSKRLDDLEQSVGQLKDIMAKMFPDAYAKYLDTKEKDHEEQSGSKE